MTQVVKQLKLADLVLWTENPRDPIRANAKDQDIVDMAVSDPRGKWDLPRLAKKMGGYYDLSELPTVVFHGQRPVVYDGNRRVVLGKIKMNLVNAAQKKFRVTCAQKKSHLKTCLGSTLTMDLGCL